MEVVAVPITIANHGARDGAVIEINLSIGREKTDAAKRTLRPLPSSVRDLPRSGKTIMSASRKALITAAARLKHD